MMMNNFYIEAHTGHVATIRNLELHRADCQPQWLVTGVFFIVERHMLVTLRHDFGV